MGVITGHHEQAGDCVVRLAHTSTQHNEKKSNSAKTNFVVEQSEVGNLIENNVTTTSPQWTGCCESV